jgi:hypothetical protein
MAPRQLCNSLLHKFFFRPRLSKSPHIFQVARAKAFDAGKLRAEILGKPFDDLRTPAFNLLPVQNVAPNRPIQQDELPVDRKRGANLGGADALLDVFEQSSIAGRCLRRFGHRLLKGMTTANSDVVTRQNNNLFSNQADGPVLDGP